MYAATIVSVEDGFRIEPIGQELANTQEVYRSVRANFQVSPEEWSKLEWELEVFGETSIERSAGKCEQVS